MIVTSCWFTALPPEYAAISISRGAPRGRSGYRAYRRLAPGPWFNSVETAEFCRRYWQQLAALNAAHVVRELEVLAAGRIPALLCWEPPTPGPTWCHRSLVSVWLKDMLDLDVFELGHEHEGCGRAHPKLPPRRRRRV